MTRLIFALAVLIATPAWGQTQTPNTITVSPWNNVCYPDRCVTQAEYDLNRALKICRKHFPGRMTLNGMDYALGYEDCPKLVERWHAVNDARIAKEAAEQEAHDLEFVKKVAEEK